MFNPLHKTARLFEGVFSEHLATKLILGVVLLVLYGFIPNGGLQVIMALFVVYRCVLLIREALTPLKSDEDWRILFQEFCDELSALTEEDLKTTALTLGLEENSSYVDIAKALQEENRNQYVKPRPKKVLAAEFVGVIGIVLLLPLNIALYTQDFVSPWEGYSYLGSAIVLVCVGLYFLLLHLVDGEESKTGYWLAIFFPAAYFAFSGISQQHQYLNPFHPEKTLIRAEKILSLSVNKNVVAGRHVFWIYDYAKLKEEQGDYQKAIQLYYQILKLSPRYDKARSRLNALQSRLEINLIEQDSDGSHARELAYSPLWAEREVPDPLQICTVDDTLGYLPETTIVIIPFGDVDTNVINIIGTVLNRELSINVCRSSKSVPLPSYDRYRGLVFGKQWHVNSLVTAAEGAFTVRVNTPVFYLFLTNEDIYSQDTNYVFSTTYNWGAVLSYHRYDEGDPLLLVQRASKQALTVTARLLGAAASPDPMCVTSYSSSLAEFDAKGNRPNKLTLDNLKQSLANRNQIWKANFAGKKLQMLD